MLQQTLAGGAKQQTGEAATTTGADHDDVMIVAGLGQCAGCGAGHDLLVDLEVRVSPLQAALMRTSRSSLEGRHDAFILGALHVRHGGDDVQLGTPRTANAAAISNAFRPHLDSSEPTATLVMVLFKCIRVAFVRRCTAPRRSGSTRMPAGWNWWCRAVVRPDHPCHGCQ